MRDKRDVIALVINTMNRYAGVYTRAQDFGSCIGASLSEIQALEVIIEKPGINHTGLSNQLGVTRGAVSKGIKKLISKNLVSSRYNVGNNKNKCLYPEEKGLELYSKYVDYIRNNLFTKVFTVMDKYENSIPLLQELFEEINTFFAPEKVEEPEALLV